MRGEGGFDDGVENVRIPFRQQNPFAIAKARSAAVDLRDDISHAVGRGTKSARDNP